MSTTAVDVTPSIQARASAFSSTARQGADRKFLRPWLLSAAFVTVIRLLHAADLGYDLTFQLQAAQNLLAGKGLSIYWATEDDLAKPLELITLTIFASGYSLWAAFLMALGAGPGLVVKISGAVATLVGWWGWAELSFVYMEDAWRRDRLWRWIGYAVAVTSPLLFTLPWSGTDIFLWAAVPWLLQLVARPPDADARSTARTDVLAGAVAGFCVLMRYAGLFLPVYAALLIICQCRARVGLPVRRTAAFGIGLLPALVLQIYVNCFLSNRPATPAGGLKFDLGVLSVATRAWEGLAYLTTAAVSLTYWMPVRVIEALAEAGNRPWVVALTVVMFLLPVLVWIGRRDHSILNGCHDLRQVGAGLFVVIPAFLWAIEPFGGFAYTAHPRYYWPLLPLTIPIAYYLATANNLRRRNSFAVLIQFPSRAYVAAFVLMGVAGIIFAMSPSDRGEVRRARLVGMTDLRPWPSFGLTYDFSPARRYVSEAMTARPDTVLITNAEHWFYADVEVDRSRVHRVESCSQLRAQYVAGPTHLLLLVKDLGGLPQEILWFGPYGERHRAACFERLPPLKLVRRFPDEELKLLETEIPAGVPVALKTDLIH